MSCTIEYVIMVELGVKLNSQVLFKAWVAECLCIALNNTMNVREALCQFQKTSQGAHFDLFSSDVSAESWGFPLVDGGLSYVDDMHMLSKPISYSKQCNMHFLSQFAKFIQVKSILSSLPTLFKRVRWVFAQHWSPVARKTLEYD